MKDIIAQIANKSILVLFTFFLFSMANPFKQLFPDSKYIDAIQIRVPHEVYRTIAQDAHIQNTSISEILMALIKERYFKEEKKEKENK